VITRADRVPQRTLAFVVAATVVVASGIPRARGADPDTTVDVGVPATSTLPGYLAAFGLDRPERSLLEEPLAWDDAKQHLAERVLARLLLAPAERAAEWESAAAPIAPDGADPVSLVGDVLLRVGGRALQVASVAAVATEADALPSGVPDAVVVRVRDPAGRVIDVLTAGAPRGWPRGMPIDEPVTVAGLPLAADTGPPSAAAATGERPGAAADLVLAARRVAWHPRTPLGAAGMDYGLFDSVVDGQGLTVAEGDPFYTLLGATVRAALPAMPITPPITDLVDPARKWFTRQRGDVVSLSGVCRRVTRIEVDDPLRRRQAGLDHYWELYVFVDTPLLQVHGELHDTYPVVCCVRELPPGMPTGQTVNEPVTVTGFAFKRYAYPLPVTGKAAGVSRRLEVPLLVARGVAWRPVAAGAPGAALERRATLLPLLLVLPLLAVVGWWLWTQRHGSRTGTGRILPDRVGLPEDEAGS
jgi:hypothetical protein